MIQQLLTCKSLYIDVYILPKMISNPSPVAVTAKENFGTWRKENFGTWRRQGGSPDVDFKSTVHPSVFIEMDGTKFPNNVSCSKHDRADKYK